MAGFVGGFEWFWLVQCFSHYEPFFSEQVSFPCDKQVGFWGVIAVRLSPEGYTGECFSSVANFLF